MYMHKHVTHFIGQSDFDVKFELFIWQLLGWLLPKEWINEACLWQRHGLQCRGEHLLDEWLT